MDSRERVQRALNHEPTDLVPFSLGFGLNPPVLKALAAELNLPDARDAKALVESKSDLVWVAPPYIGPTDRSARRADGVDIDIWGIGRRPVSYGEGSYDEICHYPLRDFADPKELDGYLFPDPDWFDYGALRGIIGRARADGNRAVILGNANIFETSWYMRGLENMMMDLLAEPDFAAELMRRVTLFYCEFMGRCLEAARGQIDLIFTADDIGQQNGLLLSLALWEKSIKPFHQQVNRIVHQLGAKVIYHTDGAVMEAVPGLIDMGIDVLEALQFDAFGMDPVRLKSLYGDRLCFHGGVSVQSTLPYSAPEDVRREVLERAAVLGQGGGYILAPSHAVQAGTPVKNVLAMFEAAGRPLR
jgi:uroporphyrinogen decarboxylase